MPCMWRSVKCLLAASVAFAADPLLSVWIKGSGGAVAPEVHSVSESGDAVEVRSAGISLHYLGALQTGPEARQTFLFRIPRWPRSADSRRASLPAGVIGAFVNGVPIWNQFELSSWREQNIWHYDPLAGQSHARSDLLENIISDSTRHSPILGYAVDGYP